MSGRATEHFPRKFSGTLWFLLLCQIIFSLVNILCPFQYEKGLLSVLMFSVVAASKSKLGRVATQIIAWGEGLSLAHSWVSEGSEHPQDLPTTAKDLKLHPIRKLFPSLPAIASSKLWLLPRKIKIKKIGQCLELKVPRFRNTGARVGHSENCQSPTHHHVERTSLLCGEDSQGHLSGLAVSSPKSHH